MEQPSQKSRIRALATLRAFLRTRLTPAGDEVKRALEVINASAGARSQLDERGAARTIFQTFRGLQAVLREAEGPDGRVLSSWSAQVAALNEPISADDNTLYTIVAWPLFTDPLAPVESIGPTRSTWHPMAFVVRRGDVPDVDGPSDTYLRVSRSSPGMYRLSESEEGGVTSFSSAGASDINDWPPRVLAVLYVRDMGEVLGRYEAHMAALTTPRIANVLGLQQSGIGGLLSILLNSPDGRQYVPAEPAAWEKEALREAEAEKAKAGTSPWVFVGIGGAAALAVGIAIVSMWPKQKGPGRRSG
jgi:hypothetical protein